MPKQRFTKKTNKKGDWKREKPERKNNMNNNMVENIMLMKLLNENNTNTDKIMQMMMFGLQIKRRCHLWNYQL